ncbi:hypothetical protein MKW92_019387 [Papaver armeniacum]|nr:hypothetical protein MKW92_019387 [Papaver armeniacum]
MGAHSKPSFFKVMFGNFKKKLKIPVNFIGKFKGMIPYDSILQSPLGCWNVKIREEEDGGLSFRKGWHDFVEAHYLGHGDFVTMKYIGDSLFAVKLYGMNGCEKVLPSMSSNGIKSTPSRKRKEYGEISKGKFTDYGSEAGHHKYHASNSGRDSFCSDKRNSGLFKCDAIKRKSTVNEGRTRVDQAECSRKGKPYFLVIWTENKKYQTVRFLISFELNVPCCSSWDGYTLGISYNGNSQFCVRVTNFMEHLEDSGNQGESNPKKRCRLSKREEDDDVIWEDTPPSRTHVESKTNEEKPSLSVPAGLDIPMQLNKDKGKRNEKTPSGERPPTLPVVKEEESDETSDSPDAPKLFRKSSRRAEGNERVAEVTKLFKSQTQYPFFAVYMRASYLTNAYLHIPKSFSRKHLPKTIKNVMVRSSDNKVWTLGYCVRGYATQFSNGWTSLRRHLGLTAGDVIVFELLTGKDKEMRVSVIREIDNVLTKI